MDAKLRSGTYEGRQGASPAAPRRLDGEEIAQWAQALVETVATRCEPLRAPETSTEATAPRHWRSIDGGLTPTTTTCQTPGGTPSANPQAGSGGRLSMRINAGSLGDLSLVIDQEGDAMSVVIGVDDPRSTSIMEPERAALGRALQASGVNVQSIRIVRASQLGTVLAQYRTAHATRTKAQNETERQQTAGHRQRRRTTRRIDLIG